MEVDPTHRDKYVCNEVEICMVAEILINNEKRQRRWLETKRSPGGENRTASQRPGVANIT